MFLLLCLLLALLSHHVVNSFWEDVAPSKAPNNRIAHDRSIIKKKQRRRLDHRICTSPERNVSWPLGGSVSSLFSYLTCGLSNDSELSRYLRTSTIPHLDTKFSAKCNNLVVYGTAFGDAYVKGIGATHRRMREKLHKQHGECYFMFCLAEEKQERSVDITAFQMSGYMWLVPIPRDVLPYKSMRRNTKIFKFNGHLLFPFVKERIVWQDVKLSNGFGMTGWRAPENFFRTVHNPLDEPCLNLISLPNHRFSLGSDDSKERSLLRHCKTILDAIRYRTSVTDSAGNLKHQCQKYLQLEEQFVEAHENTSNMTQLRMDDVLADTALMIWNVARPQCRVWNAKFQCSLLEELHCDSDRDQIAFPFVLTQMNLQFSNTSRKMDPTIHNLKLVDGIDSDNNNGELVNGSKLVMVQLIKSSCHWYYKKGGKNGCSI